MPMTTARDTITQALRRFVTGDVAYLATNDILAAQAAAGLVTVPKEATAAMAGVGSKLILDRGGRQIVETVSARTAPAEASRIWAAMVDVKP